MSLEWLSNKYSYETAVMDGQSGIGKYIGKARCFDDVGDYNQQASIAHSEGRKVLISLGLTREREKHTERERSTRREREKHTEREREREGQYEIDPVCWAWPTVQPEHCPR